MIMSYHRAGFPALWLETAEPDRATSEIATALSTEKVPTYTWDLLDGIRDGNGKPVAGASGGSDPLEALAWFSKNAPESCVLVVSLFHRFTSSPEIQQAVLNGSRVWKATQRTLVATVPPGTAPPVELQRTFHVIEQALPTASELTKLAERVVSENEGLSVEDPTAVGEALRGLTEAEAENTIALAAVREAGCVRAADVWQETATAIKTASGGALELRQGAAGFESLGGLERLKAYTSKAALSSKSRGAILLGVPGGGKTAFALALGTELGLPVYLWDLGRLFGSLVGESEAAARRAIRAIEAAGRCVLLIDEIEKGAAGMGSSGATDSGVTARTMGSVLTWLSDRKPGGAYVLATSNDVTKLPPELTRAGRWDATFFVDLPLPHEREAIYDIHAKRFGITEPFPAGLTEGWTGAEIECLCQQASMLNCSIEEASTYVVPLSRSRGEEIRQLRDWAAGRCIAASAPVTENTTKVRRIRGGNPGSN